MVSARAWLDADQIPDAGQVRVWVVIDNQSTEPVKAVHFDALRLHGFDQVPGCWRGDTPACAPDSTKVDAQDSIAPSTQLVRWAEFKRVQTDNGKSVLFGSLRWTLGATSAMNQAAVSAAPVQLVSATRPLSTTRLALLTLAGTLAGTLITLFVQVKMQRRTERQALLTTLLPKNLKNSESYYLPLQSTIKQMVTTAESSSIKYDQLAFYWLLFSRRMRYLQQKAGGFYFKSYLGEEIAATAWDEFKSQEIMQDSALVPIPTKLVFQVVGELENTTNLGDFTTTLSGNASLDAKVTTLQLGLRQWLSTESWVFAVTCAKILRVVLDFEINRPHEQWYVDGYEIDTGAVDLRNLIGTLRQLTLGGVQAEMDRRDKMVLLVEEYLSRPWRNGGLARLRSWGDPVS